MPLIEITNRRSDSGLIEEITEKWRNPEKREVTPQEIQKRKKN